MNREMNIWKAINLEEDKKHIITFVGAGGKSTSMDTIAKEFKNMGKKVLVTTTTALFYHEHIDNDEFILGQLPDIYQPMEGSITLLGSTIVDNPLGKKIKGIQIEEIQNIVNRDIFDIILIEGDGARLKPIKAPANHEPVVPAFSTMTIVIIGLDSIGLDLNEENVHRPEILRGLLEVDLPHKILPEDIIKLALHKEGIFKGTFGRKLLFLNKANTLERISNGAKICEELFQRGYKDVYIIDVKSKRIY